MRLKKKYWNTHMKKRLCRMGIDPDTYAPSTMAQTLLIATWLNGKQPTSGQRHVSLVSCYFSLQILIPAPQLIPLQITSPVYSLYKLNQTTSFGYGTLRLVMHSERR
jgi:hypothetical protein